MNPSVSSSVQNNPTLDSSNDEINELMPHKHLKRQNMSSDSNAVNMTAEKLRAEESEKNMNNMNNTDNDAEMQRESRKRSYPNPAWPSMQPVVVMPPGSNTASLGLPDAAIYRNRLSVDTGNNNSSLNQMNTMNRMLNNMNDTSNMDFKEYRRNKNLIDSTMNDYVSMGMDGMRRNAVNNNGNSMNTMNMMPSARNRNMPNYKVSDMVRIRPSYMEDMTMTEYMMGRIGEYIKVDLCCGGVGSSKVGVLREIGDDFIVLEDAESGNYMVCSLKSIQLIYVYDDGDNE